MFIIEAVVGGGVVLECIILKGGFNILPLSCMLHWITLDCTGVLNVVADKCISKLFQLDFVQPSVLPEPKAKARSEKYV